MAEWLKGPHQFLESAVLILTVFSVACLSQASLYRLSNRLSTVDRRLGRP